MEYIAIGKIVNTHGLKGELKIESWSDFDEIRYAKGSTVYIDYQDELIEVHPVSYRVHKGYALVAFEGLQDINLVEKYKTCEILIADSDRQDLPEGEYYVDELIGMTVKDEEGSLIGTVIDVEETRGAQNNLRVEREGMKDALIPYVPEFITDIDDEKGVITVHVIEGLL